jgi:PHD/YefM family antitoxin component YafN of YafNO toxin-antitoxin module
MGRRTFTSREFNQDVSKAKKAAGAGPVFITDRGQVAYVLLKVDDYQTLTEEPMNIVDMLATPEVGEIDFEPSKLSDKIFKDEELD